MGYQLGLIKITFCLRLVVIKEGCNTGFSCFFCFSPDSGTQAFWQVLSSFRPSKLFPIHFQSATYLLLSSFALVVACLARVVPTFGPYYRPVGSCFCLFGFCCHPFGTFCLARLAFVLQPVWQPYSPIGQTIYNTLSSSSLYEWNAHIKIYLFLEACLSIIEALPPVWQICICISYLTSVWLTKEGDIRHNRSWSRNKMGGRLQSSKNLSGRSRRCWSRTCSHSSTTTLSDKHNISVAGEQTH